MTEYITKKQAELIVESALREYIRTGAVETAFEKLYSLPDADVVEVVRCKNCKYKSMESGEFDGLEPACRFWTDADAIYPVFVDMNGFCSEGRQREGDESDA